MNFRTYAQSLAIPQEHITALRDDVDLQLCLGYHGEASFDVAGRGPGVLGVTDDEYAGAADVVANMRADRGDVLVVEAAGFRGEWSAVSFLMDAVYLAERSTYIGSDRIDVGPASSPDLNKLSVLAEELRRFQVVSPTVYAQILATIHGIPSMKADATKWELEEWRARTAEQWKARSLLSRLAIGKSVYNLAEVRFRDGRMVSRLGAIAASRIRTAAQPPQVVFAGGGGHGRGLRGILDALDVPYVNRNLHPRPALRKLAAEARLVGSSFLPHIVKDDEKLWLQHAESKNTRP